jgi:hypothetical protein
LGRKSRPTCLLLGLMADVLNVLTIGALLEPDASPSSLGGSEGRATRLSCEVEWASATWKANASSLASLVSKHKMRRPSSAHKSVLPLAIIDRHLLDLPPLQRLLLRFGRRNDGDVSEDGFDWRSAMFR